MLVEMNISVHRSIPADFIDATRGCIVPDGFVEEGQHTTFTKLTEQDPRNPTGHLVVLIEERNSFQVQGTIVEAQPGEVRQQKVILR